VLLFLVLWLYTAEVVICALTLSFDLNEEPVAVLDLDRSVISRQLTDQLDRSSAFDVRFHPRADREIRSLLDQGRARLVAVFPSFTSPMSMSRDFRNGSRRWWTCDSRADPHGCPIRPGSE
jgi:hypothetical protein